MYNPFDILRALVGADCRSWGGSPHVVRTQSGYIFCPDWAVLDGVPVEKHPHYVGTLADVLGEDVLIRLEEIRNLLWAKQEEAE